MKVKKALTIAGSDSGGGAGIQADIKTFQELGVYGMSVLTAVTSQNTLGVQAVYPLPPEAAARQIQSIGEDIGTDAVKTGMLFDAAVIKSVARSISSFGWEKVVVDPVMIAKGGTSLLQKEAIAALKEDLLPLAMVVTPNIPEAEELTGMAIKTEEEKKEAARVLHRLGASHVVMKGGHDEDVEKAVDILFDGENFFYFTSPRIQTKNTHGTGCTFSSAIAAELAKGHSVYNAVSTAKQFIQAAIEDSIQIGNGHGPTNHWAFGRRNQLGGKALE
ncbi:bifunctional hydroxymethylpyrimidine kinase/phosphomethylpyrimidine kinase [Neobacillus notoginsengisoli]|uniref:Hydroxymethylpyrimidine/phosphomethylpyrimidine kinase n=1 Tax=Neobacillus notoginsengisoli TaxID=1578198 RepID=A0A417YYI8_9BACI|nr:bifunctional hydroxymethylpyrimidine kinase/phosphomethylpyrimidine kinase [Neobacillus notoginsengisoli]RHW42705.1 bifunctional hydroxymethylpyrimidine kinase/phosphomethylpyrimidine kinase [Neobacillus notoginsengisoli]